VDEDPVMVKANRLWHITMIMCFLALVASASYLTPSDSPLGGTPTPRIVTDKEVYRLGETIHAEYVLVNEGERAISFQPPGTLPGIQGGFEGDVNPVSTIVNISYTRERFTLPPGGIFKVLSRDFPQLIVGNFTVWCGSASKTVKVLP
jgi:hypothetical protein